MLARLSLRTVLIVPFVALVLGLAVAIGALSYNTGRQAVLTVAEHLLLETVARIGQAVDRHVIGSGAVLEAAFPDGMTAPADIQTDLTNLRTRFWIATSLHIDPNNYVYYGNQSGQAIGLFRPSLAEGELRLKLDPSANRTRYKFRGIAGTLNYDSTEEKLFDPRQRPWYQAAAATSTDLWTSVYIDFSTNELVATRARRVLDASGNFAGVVATDMSLRALNDFVRNLKLSAHGTAFIVEPNGDLIASSSSPNVQHVGSGPGMRVNAAHSGNSLVTQIYQHVHDEAGSAQQAGGRTLVFTTTEGQDIHVGYDTITDADGLKWLTIAAMPSSDFLGGVNENLWRSVLISLFAAAIALSIGLWILHWVTDDLKRLTTAAIDLGNGATMNPLHIERQDEIGSLAKSFEVMQRQLRTDKLTGIANRDTFERQVNDTIARRLKNPEDSQGFGVLFIDLDGFKEVNDRFGHDAGDDILITVAQRLASLVGKDDLAARYAGDEFVIFLNDVADPPAMAETRERLNQGLAKSLDIKMRDGSIAPTMLSASIGQAHYPTDGTDEPTLVKIADRDMYARKQASRPERRRNLDL